MKKIIGILLVAFALVACNTAPKDATQLMGKLENAKQVKEIKIIGNDGFEQTIAIKEDGTFTANLQPVTTGYYSLALGRQRLSLYLMVADQLQLVLDLKNKELPLTFTAGKSVEANKYIQNKDAAVNALMEKAGGARSFFSLEEKEFLASLDALEKEQLAVLEKNTALAKDFVGKEKKAISYGRIANLNTYMQYHGFLTQNADYKPSEQIAASVAAVSYTNGEDYVNIPVYKELVLSHFQNKFYEDATAGKAVVKEVKATNIEALKKDFASFLVSALSLAEKDLEAKVADIKSLTSDKKVMEALDEFLKVADVLAQGKPSPKFAYQSIAGKEVKLDDLKGKLVYIDVWATWCGPCKGELPYLQQLEKDYHGKNIHFVSMSVDKDKAAWEKMVKEQKLGGIQLITDKDWASDFVTAYEIKGIPRFILLDKAGNIITADAPRPSTDEIRTLIEEWLKK